VIGGSGLVGASAVARARARGLAVSYTGLRRAGAGGLRVDLTVAGGAALDEAMRGAPDAVLFCAVAPTRAPLAEQRAVSVDGARRVLDAMSRRCPRARFVYTSTNAVFGGGSGPYAEDDPPEPKRRADPYRAYALAKAAGERVALEWADAVVARTAVVDGRTTDGALSPRLRALVEALRAGPLERFTDRIVSPTGLANLADALLEVADARFLQRRVVHLAGPDPVSDFGWARRVARRLGLDPGRVRPTTTEASADMRGTPRDTSLDVRATQAVLATRLLGVEAQLDLAFSRGAGV
jgi:dTDP-4-dehydrorhamnose reductase